MAKTRPSRRLSAVWGMYIAAFTVLIVLLTFFLPRAWRIPSLTGGIALVIFVLIYLSLRFKTLAFATDATHLTIWSGVFFQNEKRIPLDSIRYVTVFYGIPERLFKVRSLLIFATGSILLLEGLDIKNAAALQKSLLRISHDD